MNLCGNQSAAFYNRQNYYVISLIESKQDKRFLKYLKSDLKCYLFTEYFVIFF